MDNTQHRIPVNSFSWLLLNESFFHSYQELCHVPAALATLGKRLMWGSTLPDDAQPTASKALKAHILLIT